MRVWTANDRSGLRRYWKRCLMAALVIWICVALVVGTQTVKELSGHGGRGELRIISEDGFVVPFIAPLPRRKQHGVFSLQDTGALMNATIPEPLKSSHRSGDNILFWSDIGWPLVLFRSVNADRIDLSTFPLDEYQLDLHHAQTFFGVTGKHEMTRVVAQTTIRPGLSPNVTSAIANSSAQARSLIIVVWSNVLALLLTSVAMAFVSGVLCACFMHARDSWISSARRRKRLCGHCGYPLMEYPGTCPECGSDGREGDGSASLCD